MLVRATLTSLELYLASPPACSARTSTSATPASKSMPLPASTSTPVRPLRRSRILERNRSLIADRLGTRPRTPLPLEHEAAVSPADGRVPDAGLGATSSPALSKGGLPPPSIKPELTANSSDPSLAQTPNSVVLWDKIVRTPEQGRLALKSVRNKYPFKEVSNSFRCALEARPPRWRPSLLTGCP
jgi:hypothetical protein